MEVAIGKGSDAWYVPLLQPEWASPSDLDPGDSLSSRNGCGGDVVGCMSNAYDVGPVSNKIGPHETTLQCLLGVKSLISVLWWMMSPTCLPLMEFQ